MFKNLISRVVKDPNQKIIEALQPLVDEVATHEPDLKPLSDEELREKTAVFKARLADGETIEDLLPEAFALVREASVRTTGLRHYDVQIMGGILLHRGDVIEMRTGGRQNPGGHIAALSQRPDRRRRASRHRQ